MVLNDTGFQFSGYFLFYDRMNMEKWMHIYENNFQVAEAHNTKYTNNLLKLVKIAKNMLQNCE